jgi:hypothetical protein
MKSLIKKIYPDDTVLQLEINAIRVMYLITIHSLFS